jgi:hypothetical protein
MFRHAFRVGLVAIVVATTLLGDIRLLAQADAADPLLGEWTMDRAKSTFQGNPPNWRTMKFEKTPMGIKHTVDSMVGEVVQKLVYTFQVDGKDYPADVQMAVNTVAFKKIDANTFERTGKYQGEVTETVKYTLSNDGKMLTSEQVLSSDPDVVNSTQVFMKQ